MTNLVLNFEVGNASGFSSNKQGSEIKSPEPKLFGKIRKQGCFLYETIYKNIRQTAEMSLELPVLCTLR